MRDPVCASDGHSFEREQLAAAIRSCGPVSPLTKRPIAVGCVPNYALARSMELWLSEATGVEITPPALEALVEALRRAAKSAEAATPVVAPPELRGVTVML